MDRLHDQRVPAGPVVTVAGERPHALALALNDQAVEMVLDPQMQGSNVVLGMMTRLAKQLKKPVNEHTPGQPAPRNFTGFFPLERGPKEKMPMRSKQQWTDEDNAKLKSLAGKKQPVLIAAG